jgi:hypothetical protein
MATAIMFAAHASPTAYASFGAPMRCAISE